MNPDNVVLTGVVQSEIDQMPGSTMINIRLNPQGEAAINPGISWQCTLNVSSEVADHPLLTRGKKLRIMVTEG